MNMQAWLNDLDDKNFCAKIEGAVKAFRGDLEETRRAVAREVREGRMLELPVFYYRVNGAGRRVSSLEMADGGWKAEDIIDGPWAIVPSHLR